MLRIAIIVLLVVCIVLVWRTEKLKSRLDFLEEALEEKEQPHIDIM